MCKVRSTSNRWRGPPPPPVAFYVPHLEAVTAPFRGQPRRSQRRRGCGGSRPLVVKSPGGGIAWRGCRRGYFVRPYAPATGYTLLPASLAKEKRRPRRPSRVRMHRSTSPLPGMRRTRQGLDTPLYPGAVGCNPCYLALHGIGCCVAGLFYSTAARVPRFSSSFLGGPAPSVVDAASPPQSYRLAPNRTQKTPWAPASALCCYPKPPASRGDARALHEVSPLAQWGVTGRHTPYRDLAGISSRPVH